jgi:hypothetical protein
MRIGLWRVTVGSHLTSFSGRLLGLVVRARSLLRPLTNIAAIRQFEAVDTYDPLIPISVLNTELLWPHPYLNTVRARPNWGASFWDSRLPSRVVYSQYFPPGAPFLWRRGRTSARVIVDSPPAQYYPALRATILPPGRS